MLVFDAVLVVAFFIFAVILFRPGGGEQADSDANPVPTPTSLYARLGGGPAIDAAVNIFYRRVLADAYIKPFFEGVDMAGQAAKQKAFLTMVFGGPNHYTGRDMREGHKHLVKMGLDDSHFDHVLAHLRSTLAELGVGEAGIVEVINLAETTRNDVLDR